MPTASVLCWGTLSMSASLLVFPSQSGEAEAGREHASAGKCHVLGLRFSGWASQTGGRWYLEAPQSSCVCELR